MTLIFCFVVILFLSIFLYPQNKKKNKEYVFLFLSFIIVLYVHAMVDIATVPDLLGYSEVFQYAKDTPLFQFLALGSIGIKMEPGFLMCLKLVSHIYNNFQFFLWIYSIVLLGCYFFVIKKMSPNYAISVLVLLVSHYNQSLYVVRQHLVVAIMLASFSLIQNKQQLKFWLLTLLCATIHQSAFLFLPVYYIYNISTKRLPVVLTSIVIGLTLGFSVLLNIAISYSWGNSNYADGDGQNSKNAILLGAYLLIYLYSAKKEVLKEGVNRYVLVLTVLAFALSIAGIGFRPAARMNLYYTSVILLLVPITMKYIPKAVVRYGYTLFVLLVQFYTSYLGSSWGYVESFKLVPLF